MLPTNRGRKGHGYKRYLEPATSCEKIPRSSKFRLAGEGSSINATSTARPAAPDDLNIGQTDGTLPLIQETRDDSNSDNDAVTDEDATTADGGGDGSCDDDNVHSDQGCSREKEAPNNVLPGALPVLDFSIPLNVGGSITKGDALVLIIDFAIKHGLSWCGIEDILRLANMLIERDVLPESKYLFKKFSGVSPGEMRFNFYCPVCEHFLQETAGTLKERNSITPACPTCHKVYKGSELTNRGSFFVGLPLEKQIASVLSDDNVKTELLKSLEETVEPVACSASDIKQGTMYANSRRKLKCKKHDLTVTMNADGGSMFNSSNYSIWPVQLTINELPPRLRWNTILLPLLWYGSKHPNMSLLLQAFAKQMQSLAEGGVHWESGGKPSTPR